MSVLIKGMEMPTSCADCPIGDELRCSLMPGVPALWKEYTLALRTNRRHEECPLVPIPPHGRLGDLDALMRHCVMLPRDGGSLPVVYASYVRNAPTIIEAEEKGENFCGDCHWHEAEEQYCFRKGCHSYDESTCELWEPMPADEPIPAPGGKTVPTTYDLLYEEGGADTR